MMRLSAFVKLLSLIWMCTSCIDEIELPIRSEAPRLVVEGMITNEPPPYRVKLSYSGTFQSIIDISPDLFVTDANVTISDDLGNNVWLYQTEKGMYQTRDSSFVGQIGRSYQLNVELTDGKRYVSQPQRMMPTPLIDTLFSEFADVYSSKTQEPGFIVYADIKDPVETENYYRWTGFSFILKRATGVPCVIGSPQILCYEYCWLPNYDNSVRILSDAAVNGNHIQRQIVYFSPMYTIGPHLVEISQQSLTKEAYQFWKNYQQQQSRTGSIADPLPATVTGNVTNADDANEFALGYFSVSAVTRKRFTIVRNVPRFEIDQQTSGLIRQGDCRVAFPGGVLEKPSGW